MAMYLDDYNLLRTDYIVQACLINPCTAHHDEGYLIGLILHVGHEAFRCSLEYPTRQRRDAAFEEISALVRADALAEMDEEED